MNYKDTVLKQNQIKWRRPPVKYIEDGKLDVVVSIPLTRVIEGQAQISFAWGCFEALSWLDDTQKKQTQITQKMLADKMKEWGILKMYKATLKKANIEAAERTIKESPTIAKPSTPADKPLTYD